MFYSEGNLVASLVTNRRGRRKTDAMKFATAEAALGWCRSHGAMLIYLPLNPARN